jgi:hypothetical protein
MPRRTAVQRRRPMSMRRAWGRAIILSVVRCRAGKALTSRLVVLRVSGCLTRISISRPMRVRFSCTASSAQLPVLPVMLSRLIRSQPLPPAFFCARMPRRYVWFAITSSVWQWRFMSVFPVDRSSSVFCRRQGIGSVKQTQLRQSLAWHHYRLALGGASLPDAWCWAYLASATRVAKMIVSKLRLRVLDWKFRITMSPSQTTLLPTLSGVAGAATQILPLA